VNTAVQTQIAASDPATSVFVTANAGSGKTRTLVSRVARLLLRGTPPDAILCVTYTKAAAAEMQNRLFELLGEWAVAEDVKLAEALTGLDESPDNLPRARRLFARALETPGGLKIQTIHAFCEKLLKRFPLEAGVSPTFQVLEDAAQAEVSAYARDAVAEVAIEAPDGPIGRAYAHFAVELDWQRFNTMFTDFAARRTAIHAYVTANEDGAGYGGDIWLRCGFDVRTAPEDIEAEAVAGVDWAGWRDAAQVLASGSPNDQALGLGMAGLAQGHGFGPVWGVFSTLQGEPRKPLGTRAIDAQTRAWLAAEQARLGAANDRAKAARVARDTEYAITLALTYAELYEGQKTAVGALDFGDLIARTRDLLKTRADAAWVLYKLDGGIDHILLDEAQDTAPDQWEILHALTDEFFAGAGRPRLEDRTDRTVFAVGDEKQSIYSFQGADPAHFPIEQDAYRAQIQGAGDDFIGVSLEESWRSTPEVLSFVDAVFAEPEIAAGLTPGRDAGTLHHRPLRDPGFGAVEFWPLEEGEPDEETDPWAPVDAEPKESAGKKLARRIARSIKAMIETKTAVFDKAAKALRPATAGDFLILVRRRNPLFHEIIRALKREGVASGGADRMQLSEHIVFQDLVALGRFARFPGDDLTLAALLRSPFCDIDEDSLFDLAYGRGTASLWARLNARSGERREWAAARDFLSWARAEAALRPPFDLYSRVLSRLDGEGRSMRMRLLTRFGREAEDAVEAFLGEALGLEQRRVHDLERFLDEMVGTDLEVKREAEDLGGEVRVMTVHGAKGLEAPIVILPDTTTRARAQGGPLLDSEGGGFLWAPRKIDDCPASAEARDARERAADQESLRLLYVALTRARDRLIVAGVKMADQDYRGSWHEIAKRGLDRPEIAAETRVIEDEREGFSRYGADPLVAIARAPLAGPTAALPAWARRFAPAEPLVVRYASPSTFGEAERGPAPSPLAERDGLGRFRRGILIHRLLQLLPDLAANARPKAAESLLAREPDLTASQRQEMAAAALGVLNDDRFAAVFGPGSRAEAAIAGGARGLPEGLAVSGRIDRLLVDAERVLVVDFKTNRPVPDRIEDADPAYLTQMAIYVAVLAEVFPGRSVEAAIVWTDGPKLMPIPEKIVRETLAAIGAGG
jgi:ATP-dependent helicase/nuclease subunit A